MARQNIPTPNKTGPKKSDLTRQKILDHAEQLFSEKGMAGTSLRAIAESCDIQAGTILHHFAGGKDELFNELVQSIFDQLIDQLAGIENLSGNLVESILTLASSVWDYFAANPKRAKIILREAMEENSEAFGRGKFQARLISKAAKTFMLEARKKKQLTNINPEMFILNAFSLIIVYHSAPALKNMIFEDTKKAADKDMFLHNIRLMLSPA